MKSTKKKNKKSRVNSVRNQKTDIMKLLLDKSPIDLEQYTDDISSEWVDFFDEIHEHGKENEFNKFTEMCFEGEPVTIDEFNKWLEEEEDLIRDSIGLSNDDEDDDYEEEELYENEEDEEDF